MKTFIVGWLAVLAIAAGCGGKTPDAQSPENADETSSKSSDGDNEPKAAAEHATIRDDAKDGPLKCGGLEIDDLVAVLSQASCEVAGASADSSSERDVKDLLEVTVNPDSRKMAPGSKSNVHLIFRNNSKADLALDFVVDPEPHFDFELYTLKGTRVDKPGGEEPSLPSGANAPVPDKKIARITLPPQGTAKAALSWDAVKYKWASKEKAKGAVPGRGYPREAAGPLPRGKYILRVITPLVGIFEGVDHEMSQPRTQIEIGNL